MLMRILFTAHALLENNQMQTSQLYGTAKSSFKLLLIPYKNYIKNTFHLSS